MLIETISGILRICLDQLVHKSLVSRKIINVKNKTSVNNNQ